MGHYIGVGGDGDGGIVARDR